MSRKNDVCGIYFFEAVCGSMAGGKYIGLSSRCYKRKSDHFTELKSNIHGNPKLQNYYNKYGRNAFKWGIYIIHIDNNITQFAIRNGLTKNGLSNIVNNRQITHKGWKKYVIF